MKILDGSEFQVGFKYPKKAQLARVQTYSSSATHLSIQSLWRPQEYIGSWDSRRELLDSFQLTFSFTLATETSIIIHGHNAKAICISKSLPTLVKLSSSIGCLGRSKACIPNNSARLITYYISCKMFDYNGKRPDCHSSYFVGQDLTCLIKLAWHKMPLEYFLPQAAYRRMACANWRNTRYQVLCDQHSIQQRLVLSCAFCNLFICICKTLVLAMATLWTLIIPSDYLQACCLKWPPPPLPLHTVGALQWCEHDDLPCSEIQDISPLRCIEMARNTCNSRRWNAEQVLAATILSALYRTMIGRFAVRNLLTNASVLLSPLAQLPRDQQKLSMTFMTSTYIDLLASNSTKATGSRSQ